MDIAICGFGNIGKKHLSALSLIDDMNLIAVCDPNEGSEIDGVLRYNSLENLLSNHPSLDIVSICTPNYLHKEQTITVLNHGAHVICEKPLSFNSESCDEMINAAKSSGRNIFCVMQNRFSPISQWLQQIIDTNTLGQIYMVNVSCYWNRNEAYYQGSDWRGKMSKDGGTLLTQFSHYIDTLFCLLGDIKVEHASFRNFNHHDTIEFEDSCQFLFSANEQTMGSFSYTTATYNKNFESSITLIGEKGTIKVGGQYMNEIIHCDIQDYTLPELGQNDNIFNLSQVYLNAKNVILESDLPVTSPEEGRSVVEIIEKVYSFKK